MRYHLYPTFAVDHENFEKALPVALNLSKRFNLPCRFWQSGDLYAISFKDQAINHGFYYSHKHESELIANLESQIDFQLLYAKEEAFEKGKELV
ncbi:hypothetical protein V6C27_00265 [Peptococcaceae bacterium 1198_IL3148]